MLAVFFVTFLFTQAFHRFFFLQKAEKRWNMESTHSTKLLCPHYSHLKGAPKYILWKACKVSCIKGHLFTSIFQQMFLNVPCMNWVISNQMLPLPHLHNLPLPFRHPNWAQSCGVVLFLREQYPQYSTNHNTELSYRHDLKIVWCNSLSGSVISYARVSVQWSCSCH